MIKFIVFLLSNFGGYIALITFIILLVIVFAKYGGAWTGTEANRYQNLEHIVLYYGGMI